MKAANERSGLLSSEAIEFLAGAAIAAPSADNRPVFMLRFNSDVVELHANEELLAAGSTRRLLGLISVGAVVENLVLRGRRLGIQLDPSWYLLDSKESLVARITCSPTLPVRDRLEAMIEERHTNRRMRFTGPRLTGDATKELSDEAAAVSANVQLSWLDQPRRRRLALRAIRWAETERFANPALHRDMIKSIRFDVGWRVAPESGLAPGSLELGWLERALFRSLRDWKAQRVANLVGTHRFVGFRAADIPCRLAPHLTVISAEAESVDKAAVNAGRLLQRVWLRATGLGLAVQVFAAPAVYSISGATSLEPQLQARLAEIWRSLDIPGWPFMVLRLGRAFPPTVRSGRPNRG
jgi:hypothetical protein